MKLALDHVDQFIAPSNFVAERYIWADLPRHKITVIPNGIEIDRFARLTRKAESDFVRLAFVGHFGTHKGVETLLSAVAILPNLERVIVNLAGQGPQEPRYRDQIEKLGLTNHVRFLGQVPHRDIERVYENSDVVILPSVWDENQPVCLMEAMAASLPVVASRKGGIPELVEHGINGLLFEAGDHHDLALQLGKLIDAPSLRETMGRMGFKRVTQISYEHQAFAHLKLFSKLIDNTKIKVTIRPIISVVGSMLDNVSAKDRQILNKAKYFRYFFIPIDWIPSTAYPRKGFWYLSKTKTAKVMRKLKMDALFRYPRFLGFIVNKFIQRQ